MSTLKSKLLPAFAFDKRKLASLCLPSSTAHVFMNGAKAENERLIPLLTAMAEVCEASDKIKYKLDHNSGLELVWAIKELRKMVGK